MRNESQDYWLWVGAARPRRTTSEGRSYFFFAFFAFLAFFFAGIWVHLLPTLLEVQQL
jgi:hypothetical protein